MSQTRHCHDHRIANNLRLSGVDIQSSATVLRNTAKQADDLPAPSRDKRQKLRSQARWAIRHMALVNPLLDFDNILFVKRAPGTLPHISDQYYGWWSRPGGGICIL